MYPWPFFCKILNVLVSLGDRAEGLESRIWSLESGVDLEGPSEDLEASQRVWRPARGSGLEPEGLEGPSEGLGGQPESLEAGLERWGGAEET